MVFVLLLLVVLWNEKSTNIYQFTFSFHQKDESGYILVLLFIGFSQNIPPLFFLICTGSLTLHRSSHFLYNYF